MSEPIIIDTGIDDKKSHMTHFIAPTDFTKEQFG